MMTEQSLSSVAVLSSVIPVCLAVAGLMSCLPLSGRAQGVTGPGSTQIATWKDNKKAAFLLMFDDGIPTHLDHVIPELKRRGFVGTFYLNPGVKWFQARKGEWEKEATAAGMVFGNHTMTHAGATNVSAAEADIAPCNDYVLNLYPNLKRPRLISYATPGGVKWTVSSEDMDRLYSKYHLLPRPPNNGRFAGIHLKTAASLIQVIDRALAKGGLEALYFHGVGGDWLSQPKEDFVKALDHLDANRSQLWVTDPVSAQKYEAERNGGKVTVVDVGASKIRLTLSATTDRQLYDEPLTLITRVPAPWTSCRVTQAGTTVDVKAVQGEIRYDALPGTDEILIQPVL